MKKRLCVALMSMVVLPTSASVYAQSLQETTPIVQVTNALPQLSNSASTALPAKDPMNVYIHSTASQASNAGNGSKENPYNRFEDAVARVATGGTIYIGAEKGAFLNAQDEHGYLPFLIDKNITIKPVEGADNAELSVRAGGILLGANVKFENITLSFANSYHDSIFANGYRLDLINVTRPKSSREIDLFAGGLYDVTNSAAPLYRSGEKGIIYIETNGDFSDDDISQFGNIYAGSMNGVFYGDVDITIHSGIQNKLDIKGVKASGALEATVGSMFDFVEAAPPEANSNAYPVIGDVTIRLNDYQLSIDGTTGSTGETSVTTATQYPANLPLQNVQHLTVERGQISTTSSMTDELTLLDGATLDATKLQKELTIARYEGDGTIIIPQHGHLSITEAMNGRLTLFTEGAFNGASGIALPNHVYVTTPTEQADIRFIPNATQSYLQLVPHVTADAVEWMLEEQERTEYVLTPLVNMHFGEALQTFESDDMVTTNDDGTVKYELLVLPLSVQPDADEADVSVWVDLYDYPLQLTVNGYAATYREDEESFMGSHYFIEELQLGIYFESIDGFYEHNVVVFGYTTNGELKGIEAGNYTIDVAYTNEDGSTVSTLTELIIESDGEQVIPPVVEEEEPSEVVPPVVEEEKPSEVIPPVVEEEEPSEVEPPVIEEEEPSEVVPPVVEEEEPSEVEPPVIEEEEPSEVIPPVVEEEKPSEAIPPVVEEEKPSEVIPPVVEEEEPSEVEPPVIEEEEPSEVIPPVIEEEEPSEVIPPVVEEEEPSEVIPPVVEEEEPSEVIPPAVEEEEPSEVEPPVIEEEEPTEVTPPVIEEEKPSEVIPPVVEEEEPSEVEPPVIEEEKPSEVIPPVVEEEEPSEVIPPVVEEEKPSEVIPPVVEEEEPSEVIPPVIEEEEPSEVVPPVIEEEKLSEVIPPMVEEEQPSNVTPAQQAIVRDVTTMTEAVDFLSKGFKAFAERLLEQLALLGEFVELLLPEHVLSAIDEIEAKYAKMENLIFNETTRWEAASSVTSPNKTWSITLSHAVKNTESNAQFIQLVDMFGEHVESEVNIEGKTITVTPHKHYVTEIPYTLVILPGLQSMTGAVLTEGHHMTFTAK